MAQRGRFVTTQWSLVVAAADQGTPQARDALAELCAAYWMPIYVYLRRRGNDAERAGDLTQGFFATLLEKNYVGDARRERGRFRTFLLSALGHYVANAMDHERALKRGGGVTLLSIDALQGEAAYGLEPSHADTPERLFDRNWAQALLQNGLGRLRQEQERAGSADRFERMLPLVVGESDTGYRQAAAELGLSEGALKVAVHRLRRKLRAILRDEVARTVGEPALVDEELRHLFAVL